MLSVPSPRITDFGQSQADCYERNLAQLWRPVHTYTVETNRQGKQRLRETLRRRWHAAASPFTSLPQVTNPCPSPKHALAETACRGAPIRRQPAACLPSAHHVHTHAIQQQLRQRARLARPCCRMPASMAHVTTATVLLRLTMSNMQSVYVCVSKRSGTVRSLHGVKCLRFKPFHSHNYWSYT